VSVLLTSPLSFPVSAEVSDIAPSVQWSMTSVPPVVSLLCMQYQSPCSIHYVEHVLCRHPSSPPVAYIQQTQVFYYVSTVKIQLLNTQHSAAEWHAEHLPKTKERKKKTSTTKMVTTCNIL